jgi:hypothetical protein
VNGTFEDRVGGDLNYIKDPVNNSNLYFEENKTTRISTQAGYDYNINQQSKLSLKNSVSFYNRSIAIPGYGFAGLQTASFTEASYRHENEKLEWITGMNVWTDQFTQNKPASGSKVNYSHTLLVLFVQNTWNATEQFILETGCVAITKMNMDFLRCREFLRCTNSVRNSPCVLVADLVIKHQLYLQKMRSVSSSVMYYLLM